jgi:hypothetical protein
MFFVGSSSFDNLNIQSSSWGSLNLLCWVIVSIAAYGQLKEKNLATFHRGQKEV